MLVAFEACTKGRTDPRSATRWLESKTDAKVWERASLLLGTVEKLGTNRAAALRRCCGATRRHGLGFCQKEADGTMPGDSGGPERKKCRGGSNAEMVKQREAVIATLPL
jgi:hypothetical protein